LGGRLGVGCGKGGNWLSPCPWATGTVSNSVEMARVIASADVCKTDVCKTKDPEILRQRSVLRLGFLQFRS
jgi:hypothetical protein